MLEHSIQSRGLYSMRWGKCAALGTCDLESQKYRSRQKNVMKGVECKGEVDQPSKAGQFFRLCKKLFM